MIGEGQLEVVRLVVGSAANKDQSLADDEATPFTLQLRKCNC